MGQNMGIWGYGNMGICGVFIVRYLLFYCCYLLLLLPSLTKLHERFLFRKLHPGVGLILRIVDSDSNRRPTGVLESQL